MVTLPFLTINKGNRKTVIQYISNSSEGAVNRYNTNGLALLHLVAIQKDFHLCKKILAESAEPNIQDSAKNTPLHFACEYGSLSIVKQLWKANADPLWVNKAGITPFVLACKHNYLNIVKHFLENINNVYQLDLKQAYQAAQDTGALPVLSFLRLQGVEANIGIKKEFKKVISSGNNNKIKNMLCQKPSLIDTYYRRRTPLFAKINGANIETAKIFLKEKSEEQRIAYIELFPASGNAIQEAKQAGHAVFARFLINQLPPQRKLIYIGGTWGQYTHRYYSHQDTIDKACQSVTYQGLAGLRTLYHSVIPSLPWFIAGPWVGLTALGGNLACQGAIHMGPTLVQRMSAKVLPACINKWVQPSIQHVVTGISVYDFYKNFWFRFGGTACGHLGVFVTGHFSENAQVNGGIYFFSGLLGNEVGERLAKYLPSPATLFEEKVTLIATKCVPAKVTATHFIPLDEITALLTANTQGILYNDNNIKISRNVGGDTFSVEGGILKWILPTNIKVTGRHLREFEANFEIKLHLLAGEDRLPSVEVSTKQVAQGRVEATLLGVSVNLLGHISRDFVEKKIAEQMGPLSTKMSLLATQNIKKVFSEHSLPSYLHFENPHYAIIPNLTSAGLHFTMQGEAGIDLTLSAEQFSGLINSFFSKGIELYKDIKIQKFDNVVFEKNRIGMTFYITGLSSQAIPLRVSSAPQYTEELGLQFNDVQVEQAGKNPKRFSSICRYSQGDLNDKLD